MSKSKEELARREGMAYALRVAKEKGIEALEKDLQRRGAVDIPVRLDLNQFDAFVENVKHTTLDTVLILSLVTLHDEFDMEHDDLNRFKKRFNLKSETISGDYSTWQDQVDILMEECGMKVDIRNNEEVFHKRKEE